MDLQVRTDQTCLEDFLANMSRAAITTLPCRFTFLNGCTNDLCVLSGDTVAFFISLFNGNSIAMRGDSFKRAFFIYGVDGLEVVR